MSPEMNGNPPSVTKRKKNRDKKPPQQQQQQQNIPIDFNMSTCNYFPTNPSTTTYQNVADLTHYYSFLNYTNPTEPMSLPVYPVNYPNYYQNFLRTPKMFVPSTPLTTPNNNDTEYLSLPVGNVLDDDDDDDDTTKRRYSDPGMLNESSDSSTNSLENKIIQKLTQQVSVLKESNRKLTTQMMEMRIELNMLKQQQQQQQNLRHYERDYEPGMLADIIREVRDAARVREDALLARVKHMIEEKQLSLNHLQLVNEKNRNNDRISKIEEQLKSLTVNGSRSEENLISTVDENSTTARQVLELEREALELRRELQDTRAKKEEADQKLLQLDKKFASMMRRNDISSSEISEDCKTNSIDTVSITTTSSISQVPPPPRVTLSGPVTDL